MFDFPVNEIDIGFVLSMHKDFNSKYDIYIILYMKKKIIYD